LTLKAKIEGIAQGLWSPRSLVSDCQDTRYTLLYQSGFADIALFWCSIYRPIRLRLPISWYLVVKIDRLVLERLLIFIWFCFYDVGEHLSMLKQIAGFDISGEKLLYR